MSRMCNPRELITRTTPRFRNLSKPRTQLINTGFRPKTRLAKFYEFWVIFFLMQDVVRSIYGQVGLIKITCETDFVCFLIFASWTQPGPCGSSWAWKPFPVPHFLEGRFQPPWPSLSSKGRVPTVASQGRKARKRQGAETTVQAWGRALGYT